TCIPPFFSTGLKRGLHGVANIGRTFHHADAGGFHGGHLLFGRTLPSGDDRARVPHPSSWRRGLTANESHHGLLHIRFDVSSGFFFRHSTDLADHDDAARFGIFVEQPNGIDEVRADNRIAPDPDAGGLPQFSSSQLPHGLVSQCPTAGHHAHVT